MTSPMFYKANHLIKTDKFTGIEFSLTQNAGINQFTDHDIFRYEKHVDGSKAVLEASEDSHYVFEDVTHLFHLPTLEQELNEQRNNLPDLTEEYLEAVAEEEAYTDDIE
jgi:hypothetical protein